MAGNPKYPRLSLAALDQLFQTPTLKDRNETFRNIATEILFFGLSHRETAKAAKVHSSYVNAVMNRVMSAYHATLESDIPPGFERLDNIVVSSKDAQKIKRMSRVAQRQIMEQTLIEHS